MGRGAVVLGAGGRVRSQSDVRLSDGARPLAGLPSVVWGVRTSDRWETLTGNGLAVHQRQEVKETRGKLLTHLSRWPMCQ